MVRDYAAVSDDNLVLCSHERQIGMRGKDLSGGELQSGVCHRSRTKLAKVLHRGIKIQFFEARTEPTAQLIGLFVSGESENKNEGTGCSSRAPGVQEEDSAPIFLVSYHTSHGLVDCSTGRLDVPSLT
jgi:hypothetical protein